MSFEQTAPPSAPVYRLDEFERKPTGWTLPMQRAVGLYLIVGTILAFVVYFAVQTELHRVVHDQLVKSLATQSQKAYTAGEINTLTDQSLLAGLIGSVFFGLIAVAFGAVTLARRATWIFIVDMVLTGFGVLGLIFALISLVSPQKVALSAAYSVLQSMASTALFAWMMVGLVKYGPWAEEKVPVAL